MASQLLFDTLLEAVTRMRALQILRDAGAPWVRTDDIMQAEQEVDDLVQLHNAPSVMQGVFPDAIKHADGGGVIG